MTQDKRSTIDQFHNELIAAIDARVPVRFDSHLLSRDANVARLTRLRNSIQSRAVALDEFAHDDPGPESENRYLAAYRVFSKTQSMSGVLDGLSISQRVDRQLARIVRAPMFYLLFLVLIAGIGLFFFAEAVLPSFKTIRDDLGLAPVIDAPKRNSNKQEMVIASQVLSVIATVGFVFALTGGARRLAMWMGGSLYHRCQMCSSAIRVAQALMLAGTQSAEAIKLACTLVGADHGTDRVLENAVSKRAGDADHFREMYDHYQMIARSRLAWMRVTVPAVIVTLVGGVLVGAYCIAIFTPMVQIIDDLSLPGLGL